MPHMRATAGITLPKLARDPLGTEAELSPGDPEYNPYEDPEADVDEMDAAPEGPEPLDIDTPPLFRTVPADNWPEGGEPQLPDHF